MRAITNPYEKILQPFDTLRTKVIPSNVVTKAGLVEVAGIVQEHYSGVSYSLGNNSRALAVVESIGNDLVNKNGKFVTRLSRYLYKEYGIKLDDSTLTDIGNTAAKYSAKTQTVYYDFTHNFDWQSGDFNDDTCYFSSHAGSMSMIMGGCGDPYFDGAGFAFRTFVPKGEYAGVSAKSTWYNGEYVGGGRCWLVPMKVPAPELGMVAQREWPSILVLFGAYGAFLKRAAATFILDLLVEYGRLEPGRDIAMVDGKAANSTGDNLYINRRLNNSGAIEKEDRGDVVIVGRPDVLALWSATNLDFRMPNKKSDPWRSSSCHKCRSRGRRETMLEYSGYLFCQMCQYNCPICGVRRSVLDKRWVYNNPENPSEQIEVCSGCFSNMESCAACSNRFHPDMLHELVDGLIICPVCSLRVFVCEDCQAAYRQDIAGGDGPHVCRFCQRRREMLSMPLSSIRERREEV